MAEVTPQLDLETLYCSICLKVLKDPVTIPCGHSFCMSCIESRWNRCYQCERNFTSRPVLVKNTVLANLVEQLTTVQALPADHCYAGPEDVACDFCTRGKLKAVKSCLVCLASYCEEHLQPHYDVAALQYHKLVDPSKEILDNICSLHGELMKIFCRTDQQSICYLCFMDEHKGHDTVSAAEERTERMRELEVSRLNIQEKIQERELGIKLLKQQRNRIFRAEYNSEEILNQLIPIIVERTRYVNRRINSDTRTEAIRVKDLQEKLQQEISELKRSVAELQEISHTEDLHEFLQNYPAGSPLSESTGSFSINVRPLSWFKEVTAAVSAIRDKVEDVLREKWTNVFLTVAEVEVLFSPSEPNTRAGFLKYSLKIPLDPNTAHAELLLSDGNRKAALVRQKQSYPHHPDRFGDCEQVLSRESLVNRCYWELYLPTQPYRHPCLRSRVLQNRSVPGPQSRRSVLLRRL
ncbi:E3 ubiquitin/ISG15 ligase TRIM25-like [Spinachia spinachia]